MPKEEQNRPNDRVVVRFKYEDYSVHYIPLEVWGEETPIIPPEILVEEEGRTYLYDYDTKQWELKDE